MFEQQLGGGPWCHAPYLLPCPPPGTALSLAIWLCPRSWLGTCHHAAAALPAQQVGAFPSLALSPGGRVTCHDGGNLVASLLPSQHLDTPSGAAASGAVTLGPSNEHFALPR